MQPIVCSKQHGMLAGCSYMGATICLPAGCCDILPSKILIRPTLNYRDSSSEHAQHVMI
jgi:hypothetical protein